MRRKEKGRKAQASVEFLVVIAALLMIFTIIYAVSAGQSTNLKQAHDYLGARENAYALATAINYVHIAGDGARYKLMLGRQENENITISGLAVESKRQYSAAQAPVLNANINTTGVYGREIVIKNNHGAIEIEQ